MQKVTLFDTSSGSLNLGDYIINESVAEELEFITNESFVAKYATHTPVMHFYQNFKQNTIVRFARESKFKFISGTNIVAFNNFRPWPNWNVNIFNYHPYKNSILVGSGSTPNSKKINLYTKLLYKKILSIDYIHSVRDERTKNALESIGLKAINTGCATLWDLTPEKCSLIPRSKASKVVFTLTDYARDTTQDQLLIDILNKNYENVYFWPQGSDDMDYFNELRNTTNIHVVASNLESYRQLLQAGNIDYVGTRLHAGIFAMKNLCRSVLIAVDNRTVDMQKTYNLNAIERKDTERLSAIINEDIETNINIDLARVEEWKKQFKN